MSQPTLNITADDLKEMIATAVAAAITESRKPDPPTEQQLAATRLAQEHREQQAASVIAEINNKRAVQLMCVHEHAKKAGGGSHCVHVREEDPRSPGFILCQLCQARIRPGDYDKDGLPYQRDRGAIYNNDTFNRLFQDCAESAVMG